jgi:CO dehydrogenase nickel-insertion accessory protein CooC1
MIAYSAIALFCDTIISICTAPANSLQHNQRIHELMKLIREQTPFLAGRSAEEAHDEDRRENEQVVYPLVEGHSHS